MPEQGTYHFRVFLDDMPRVFERWRPAGDTVQWDRHYVVREGYSLVLVDKSHIEVRALGQQGPFRTEQLMCQATFPLDWMALALIRRVLPITDPLLDIDGREPDAFVESLERPDIIQAMLVKVIKRRLCGAASAEVIDFAIPGWNSLGVCVGLETSSVTAMRMSLSALNLRDDQHVDYHQWIAAEAERVLPPRRPMRRFGFPLRRAA